MQIAVAPNAFRGSLTAFQAAVCITEGLQRSRLACDVLTMPLADGGDSTLDVMLLGMGGERLSLMVSGPNGAPIHANLGLMADGMTAVVELAQAAGVERLPIAERDALRATTRGVGELIDAALTRGFRRIIVGLGGSATTDGGAGCIQALGGELLDSAGNPIPPGGLGLAQLTRINVDRLRARVADAEFVALCDVENPLTGDQGAARIFAPQKGADAAAVETLESCLSHFADVVRRDLGINLESIVGGGAAGGAGAGLAGLLGATIAPGARTLISLLGYDQQLESVELVITGEGKLDAQTASGKGVRAISDLALSRQIPVIALVGTLDSTPDDLRQMGIDAAWSILREPCSTADALAHAGEWLTLAALELGNTLALTKSK